jgi:phage-related protein
MAGKRAVDKVSKGLNALIDEFAGAVKEMVNAGEATVVELAVGSSRVIKAVVDATGEVTKVSVETATNVVGHVAEGVTSAVAPVTKRGALALKAMKNDQEE